MNRFGSKSLQSIFKNIIYIIIVIDKKYSLKWNNFFKIKSNLNFFEIL